MLYEVITEMDWSRARLAERAPEQLDTETLLNLAETELMAPLDAAARLEIEAAARTVATVTALVPLALADRITSYNVCYTKLLRASARVGLWWFSIDSSIWVAVITGIAARYSCTPRGSLGCRGPAHRQAVRTRSQCRSPDDQRSSRQPGGSYNFV